MSVIVCIKCRHEAPASAFTYGVKGDGRFRHPDHRYCPNCGASIDWYGYKVSVNLPTMTEDEAFGILKKLKEVF